MLIGCKVMVSAKNAARKEEITFLGLCINFIVDFLSYWLLYFVSGLGHFTRNYTQTVKRAADNKRRYAPVRGSIALVCWGGGIQRGQRPIWHTTLLAKCSVLYALSALLLQMPLPSPAATAFEAAGKQGFV